MPASGVTAEFNLLYPAIGNARTRWNRQGQDEDVNEFSWRMPREDAMRPFSLSYELNYLLTRPDPTTVQNDLTQHQTSSPIKAKSDVMDHFIWDMLQEDHLYAPEISYENTLFMHLETPIQTGTILITDEPQESSLITDTPSVPILTPFFGSSIEAGSITEEMTATSKAQQASNDMPTQAGKLCKSAPTITR